MTGLTKRLPVRFVPEQRRVAAMRDNVINDRRGREATLAMAFRAERMSVQEKSARPLPAFVVTARGGIFAGIQGAMFFAVNAVREIRAARMAAGALGFMPNTVRTARYSSC